MHGKGEFSNIKRSFCNMTIGTANIWNIWSKPTFSNELVVAKLKRDLKSKGHIYFEPVHPQIIYQAFAYLKSHYWFYENISIAKGLSGKDMFRFSDIVEIPGQNKNATEKLFLIEKKLVKIEMTLKQNTLQLKISSHTQSCMKLDNPYFWDFKHN